MKIKIKCSKIVYDPDFAKPGLKKTVTVEIDRDWLDVIIDLYDDSDESVSELDDTIMEEIERLVGCPVISIGKYSEVKNKHERQTENEQGEQG